MAGECLHPACCEHQGVCQGSRGVQLVLLWVRCSMLVLSCQGTRAMQPQHAL